MNDPIYLSGLSTDGRPFVAGLWTHYSQNGFPLELSNIEAMNIGCPDWFEAMCDASRTHSLPALMAQLEVFLDQDTILRLKADFSIWLKKGETFQSVIDGKRKTSQNLANLFAQRSAP